MREILFKAKRVKNGEWMKPLNRLDYTFCPYCGGLIVREKENVGE